MLVQSILKYWNFNEQSYPQPHKSSGATTAHTERGGGEGNTEPQAPRHHASCRHEEDAAGEIGDRTEPILGGEKLD